nr:MAG TPA: hypothetical protein [Caudoviricetes sp.]
MMAKHIRPSDRSLISPSRHDDVEEISVHAAHMRLFLINPRHTGCPDAVAIVSLRPDQHRSPYVRFTFQSADILRVNCLICLFCLLIAEYSVSVVSPVSFLTADVINARFAQSEHTGYISVSHSPIMHSHNLFSLLVGDTVSRRHYFNLPSSLAFSLRYFSIFGRYQKILEPTLTFASAFSPTNSADDLPADNTSMSIFVVISNLKSILYLLFAILRRFILVVDNFIVFCISPLYLSHTSFKLIKTKFILLDFCN